MTMQTKVEGDWKDIDSFYCKRNGTWKSVHTIYSKIEGAWVVVFEKVIFLGFSDYPYPIPVVKGWKYKVDGGEWVDITADGEINADGGTFTGVVKGKGYLTLEDWFTEEIVEYGDAVRMDGTPLSVSRYDLTSFANGGKGYVCGGRTSGSSVWDDVYYATVDVYDAFGNRTTGTELSVSRYDLTSFANGGKGYVCGGFKTNGSTTTVDVYDSSGNRTTGTPLSEIKYRLTSFVNGGKGYVCGGDITSSSSSTVDVYDTSGNRTTGNALGYARGRLTSFVNGEKGYVCGGSNWNGGRTTWVDVYDASGNRTTGTNLSEGRYDLTSFANGGKGYVCGGYTTEYASTVDLYDISGNRTNGNSLSVGRIALSSFVNNENGYVCGGFGKNGYNIVSLSTVDVYDISGNRTNGNSLNQARRYFTSFVNNKRGYVCGGYDDSNIASVEIYYNEEIYSYKAKLPLTTGSYYQLNNISGYATENEVMVFDEKVTGTIEYQSGVIPRRGLIYDKAIPSDTDGCLTYTGLAMGMTPMSGASGSANGGSWESDSLFASIQVGYLNGSTWTQDNKASMVGSTTYNCFTRIPKIYQRVTKMDDYRVELVLDTKPFKGATLHPAFVMDGVEVNYKYIGRFLGRNVSSKLTSTSGGQPTHSLTRAEFRTLAKANGSNYGLMSYYDWDLVNKLFLFAFKNFDSQTALGKGWTGKTTYRNTGSSNGYAWNCGWQDATTVMSFIGIEDWWGNTFTLIDNFLTDASYIYASQLSNPVDDVAGMTAICPNPTALSGIPLTVRGGLNDFFIAESVGGSETTGICDQQYYDAEQNGGRVGAYYGSANVGGAFYLNAQNSISSAGTSVGARLVHWE